MFGRKLVLPVEIRSDASEDVDNVFATHDEDALQEQLEAKKKILEQAKENIVDAQQKQKTAYDRKHATRPAVFAAGALVLKKDFTRKKRKGGKVDAKWVGPYMITQILGRGLYCLQSLDDSSVVIS